MTQDLDESHIDMILKTHHIGRLGCCWDNQPYVVPMTYVFDGDFIYGHTNEGEKTSILRQNPQVCFEVDDIQDTLRWRSVLVKGRYEELSGQDAADALDVLFSHLQHRITQEPSFSDDGSSHEEVLKRIRMRPAKGVVYRVRPIEKSGRYERQ